MLNGAQFGVVGTRPLPSDIVDQGMAVIHGAVSTATSALHPGGGAPGLNGAFGEGAGGAEAALPEAAAAAVAL